MSTCERCGTETQSMAYHACSNLAQRVTALEAAVRALDPRPSPSPAADEEAVCFHSGFYERVEGMGIKYHECVVCHARRYWYMDRQAWSEWRPLDEWREKPPASPVSGGEARACEACVIERDTAEAKCRRLEGELATLRAERDGLKRELADANEELHARHALLCQRRDELERRRKQDDVRIDVLHDTEQDRDRARTALAEAERALNEIADLCAMGFPASWADKLHAIIKRTGRLGAEKGGKDAR